MDAARFIVPEACLHALRTPSPVDAIARCGVQHFPADMIEVSVAVAASELKRAESSNRISQSAPIAEGLMGVPPCPRQTITSRVSR